MATMSRTKLAEMAGTDKLRGAVCVTDASGVTHVYASEAEAAAEWGARAGELVHHRGAFHQTSTPDAGSVEEAPRRRRKRRSASSDG